MPTPTILYKSSNNTDAKPYGVPLHNFPLPSHSPIRLAAYGFEQDYEQALSSFPPAVINQPSTLAAFNLGPSGNPNAILADYSPPQTTGAKMGRYQCRFNIVPASWDDFITAVAFTFPGFPGRLGSATVRDPFTDIVPVRTHYDYFVIDPGNVLGGAPSAGGGVKPAANVIDSAGALVNTVYSGGDIPAISKSNFVWAPRGVPNFGLRTNGITPVGGITFDTGSGDSPTSVYYNQTLPTVDNYQAWIANAKAIGWKSTPWDGVTDSAGASPGFGQLVIEDSVTQPYAGLIVARVTKYVLVK